MTRKILILFLICSLSFKVRSQEVSGKWIGHFNSKGDVTLNASGETEYIIEITVNGERVSGYSYSYFSKRKYYTICSLDGTYNASTKKIQVTEVKRIKGNLPFTTNTVLQTHYLNYTKNGDKEVLSGIWKASNKNKKDEGKTALSRYTPKENPTVLNKPTVSVKEKSEKPEIKIASRDTIVKEQPKRLDLPDPLISSRTNVVESKIALKSDSFYIDLYDNGEIDGDTVTVFYNGKAVANHVMISDKPISLKLAVEQGMNNTLVLYANNLGRIPPNTAVMIIRDISSRYEVRLSSDMKKSSAVEFTYNPKAFASK